MKIIKHFKEKIQQSRSRYELTTSVNIADVKTYLQKEYDRADEREEHIKVLEAEIENYIKIDMKYQALLVVQENTQKRIEKQNETIKDLRAKIKKHQDEEKMLRSKITDIKINADKEIKEKDKTIKKIRKESRK